MRQDQPCGSQRPPHQDRRPFADHRGHGIEAERFAAELDEQRVHRVGEIPARIDERAVEIENHQPDRHGRIVPGEPNHRPFTP